MRSRYLKSSVEIFIGVTGKFKLLDISECSSEESDYDDNMTTISLGISSDLEPGLGQRDSNFLT